MPEASLSDSGEDCSTRVCDSERTAAVAGLMAGGTRWAAQDSGAGGALCSSAGGRGVGQPRASVALEGGPVPHCGGAVVGQILERRAVSAAPPVSTVGLVFSHLCWVASLSLACRVGRRSQLLPGVSLVSPFLRSLVGRSEIEADSWNTKAVT